MKLMLKIRWFAGVVWAKQEWKCRTVTDADTLEELMKWTQEMRDAGWEDMAAIGDRLYLRRFVERWPWPEPPSL